MPILDKHIPHPIDKPIGIQQYSVGYCPGCWPTHHPPTHPHIAHRTSPHPYRMIHIPLHNFYTKNSIIPYVRIWYVYKFCARDVRIRVPKLIDCYWYTTTCSQAAPVHTYIASRNSPERLQSTRKLSYRSTAAALS